MGSTALQLDWNALICYAAKGDLEAVTCLIEGQISGRADIREMTLVRKRFPPDMVGLYGDTPLHAAANNGHVEVVDFLLKSLADPSAQNDMGQTPLVCASMQGHDKVVSRLLVSDQVDAWRLTIDGKNALSVAATPECRFLLRMLTSDEEEEEARRRAEQTQARVNMMMLRWTKAAMVGAYYKWKDFALVPENKINRLVADLDSYALQQTYETPPTGFIHAAHAVDLRACFASTQLVVYSGRRSLGSADGSGHPLLFAPSSDVDALKLTATLRLLGGDKSEKASVEGVKSEKASVEGVTSPPHKKEEEEKKEHGAIEIRIERPAERYKRAFHHAGDGGEAQLKELESDEWGQRSIATARKWVTGLLGLLSTAARLASKYSFILDEARPGSSLTNLQLMQQALLRLIHRLVKPHRSMLHGLRPWAFRSSAVQRSQALVNSRDFPPNFPGAPSDRRLYASRFLHVWAWMTALNNPPGYPPLPHLQKKLEECANVLRLEKDARLLYACNPVFEPKPEAQRLGTRLHIQVLNLPLPPPSSDKASLDGDYYCKAIAKVDGEPATDVGLRQRGGLEEQGAGGGDDIAHVFTGAMILDAPDADWD